MILDYKEVQTKEALMEWIGEHFHFPPYFGKNWDAVEECLRETSLSDGKIELLHTEAMTEEMKQEMAVFRDIAAEYKLLGQGKIEFFS